MSSKRRKLKVEEHENSERWLLTYADMITLLTAFFIMMYSMSVLNLEKFNKVAISIRSGFGGTLDGGGDSILNPALGNTIGPGTGPDIAPFMPSVMAQQVKGYAKRNNLEKELRITETERGLVVSILTDRMLFPKGQAALTPEAAQLLSSISGMLAKTSNFVRIEGHTDNLPIRTERYPSNWELSTARASAVVRYLIEVARFNPARISAAGYADSRPLYPNDTEAHRAMNRRVDIVIMGDDRTAAPTEEHKAEGHVARGPHSDAPRSDPAAARPLTVVEKPPARHPGAAKGPQAQNL